MSVQANKNLNHTDQSQQNFLKFAEELERPHLSPHEIKKLKDQLGSMQKGDRNLFFATLHKTLSPFPKNKDYYKCAEDAFYGRNKLSCTPGQIAQTLRNCFNERVSKTVLNMSSDKRQAPLSSTSPSPFSQLPPTPPSPISLSPTIPYPADEDRIEIFEHKSKKEDADQEVVNFLDLAKEFEKVKDRTQIESLKKQILKFPEKRKNLFFRKIISDHQA